MVINFNVSCKAVLLILDAGFLIFSGLKD